MRGSLERVRAVVHGRVPDRTPLYDLLRNDAVVTHFTGDPLSIDNASEVVYRAYEPAIDATRPMVRLPRPEGVEVLADGRQEQVFRWTSWVEPVRYADSDAWAAAKRQYLRRFDPAWSAEKAAVMRAHLESAAEHRRKLGEVFFFSAEPFVSVQAIYGEVGLEAFAYFMADHPGVVEELLECATLAAIEWARHLPIDHGLEAVFVGDDIAFKTAPLLAPEWFEAHYFHRVARVCDAYHRRGIKLLFHSDGNLNLILAGLVEAGIDGINPIEVLAGMDVAEIHRRYSRLFMAGGIDVSQLLPFGKPREVKDAVRRAIDGAEGRIMIGSSTELHNAVPLANFLAMREAVLET